MYLCPTSLKTCILNIKTMPKMPGSISTKTTYSTARPSGWKAKEMRYHSRAWIRLSQELRALNPYCKHCGILMNHINEGVVDHIYPVSEGGSFYDSRNHQVLCLSCHSSKTLRDQQNKYKSFQLNGNGERIPL